MRNFLTDLDPKALARLTDSLAEGGRVGIACSGGSDSVFLLLCALQIVAKDRIVVLHFNHAVRETAVNDENFVKALCEKTEVECVCKTRKTPLKKLSEETLREVRFKFFENTAKSENLCAILQGHIMDDVAETMLMRLMRGASLDGLCAPRPVSERNGVTFIRPLLGLSKNDIQQKLAAAGQDWCEDESNAQNGFLRNTLRNVIIPEIEKSQNRDFKSSAARSRMLLEEDSILIEEVFSKHCRRDSTEGFVLDSFAASSPALARRCVHVLLSANSLRLRAACIDAFINEIMKAKNAAASLNGAKLMYDSKTRRVFICKSLKAQDFCVDLKTGRNTLPDGSVVILENVEADAELFALFKSGKIDESKTAYVSAASHSLCARSLKPNDAYSPTGAKSPRLVRSMLSARKTGVLKRKRLPLVCLKNGDALWVPTLAPSSKHKVEKGRGAIRLTYIEQS